MNNQDFWAFLVGIDEYASPSVPTLRGCGNDVQAMRIFLRETLGVPERQIRVLANREATRQRILDEFGTFLIDNDEIAPGSQILFHYSGHGSQMPNTTGTEPDGRDETLVPHDSRVGGVFDIPDKTLAALIQRLATKRGQNITVILDCCHSGSGTRALLTNRAVVTRRAPFDERRPPLDLDAAYRAGTATRNAGRSGWAATAPNHVLLAGCLDREESHEHWTGDVQHGALTFFLLRYLREMPAGATYADLIDSVRPEVNAHYPLQTPQCEGQRDRQVFGGAVVERSLFIPARPAAAGEVRLEAGVVHGMNVGAEVAIYPPLVAVRDPLPPPLATGRVTAVGATEATVVLEPPPSQPLPVVVRVLVTREAATNALLRVLLAATDPVSAPALASVRAAIENARGQGKPSPYLEIVEDESQPFDVRVVVESGQFSLRDPQGKPLVLPQDLGEQGAKTVCTALESIARFRIVVEMRNREKSQLGGKIGLRLRRYEAGKKPDEMAVVAAAEDGALTLEYEPQRPEYNRYVVEVENSSAKDVFAHVFILNPDYSILRLYPIQGQNDTLRAGASLYCLPEAGGDYLKLYLPGDHPGEERWDASHDQLKLIVTTKPCDLEKLQQRALEVPAAQRGGRTDSSSLEQLLETIAAGGATRFSYPERTDIGEDWATTSLAYTVLRKSVVTALDAAKAALPIGDGLVLEKPQGFEGTISVAPLEQSRRGLADEPPLKFPPGLERLSEVFAPVARAGTRGFGGEPLVLTLETDEVSRALIAPDNPLRLKLSETAEDYLPIAFDGEDYLPVGFGSDAGTVDIVRLPRAVTSGGQPTTRGIGRAIRLFVFKKLGRISRDVGLRAVESSDASYRYIPIDKHRFQPGNRVALLVHGFLSDTAWLARDVAPFLRREVLPYEHILTWDYETFGTSVERTGAELAAALRQRCGLGRDDGLTLHVYAHSMGTLVSRCLVECAGGHDFVDRMVLAGPPNRGTTLASMSRGMTYLLAALLNGLGELPVAGAASWALKQLYEHGHGWEDLETDSDLTRRINELETPNNVRYLVLAGDNTRNQCQGARLARLAHKLLDRGLDTVFGERENDAVVPMSSMLGLRNGSYPLLESRVLPCDHFSYFALPEGRAAIREWVPRA